MKNQIICNKWLISHFFHVAVFCNDIRKNFIGYTDKRNMDIEWYILEGWPVKKGFNASAKNIDPCQPAQSDTFGNFYLSLIFCMPMHHFRVPRGSVVRCLTCNPGVLGSSLTGSSGFLAHLST